MSSNNSRVIRSFGRLLFPEIDDAVEGSCAMTRVHSTGKQALQIRSSERPLPL